VPDAGGSAPRELEDIALIEGWIRAGYPDEPTQAVEQPDIVAREIFLVDDVP
jgi:hypothetical protein